MSLQTRLEALVAAIGADVKQAKADVLALPPIPENPWTENIRTTDISTTSNVTPYTNIFTGFVPAINSNYLLESMLLVTSAALGTGVQTVLVGQTTAGVLTRATVRHASASASTSQEIFHATSLNVPHLTTGSLTLPTVTMIEAIIQTGGTAGTSSVNVGFKSEVSGSAVTIRAGSYLRWRKLS